MSEAERGPRWAIVLGALHLWVLASFAVAQPVFDALGRNPEFFVAHAAGSRELFILTLLLFLVVPLPLILFYALSSVLGSRVRAAVLSALVGVLAMLVAMPTLKTVVAGPLLAGAGLAIAAVATLAYARLGVVRTLLTILSPAPLVFAGMFLFASPVTPLLAPSVDEGLIEGTPVTYGEASETTVVMIVLDEFPISSLMNEDLEIDADRFPAFAALAERSTWYRDTTTVHADTSYAVPALMTGRATPHGQEALPIAKDHPRSLFAALSDTHLITSWESFTQICPPGVCDEQPEPEAELPSMVRDVSVIYGHMVAPDRWARQLPPITDRWANFGDVPEEEVVEHEHDENDPRHSKDEVVRFRGFVDDVRATDEPAFWFLHAITPHQPWVLLPSGRQYDARPKPPGIQDSPVWPDELRITDATFRRHLLQVRFLDSLLEEAMDKLEQEGILDDALLVVTADHGVSFAPGGNHRWPSEDNLDEVARIPLFIKAPGQSVGVIDDRPVELTDVAPTILDMLDIDVDWDFSGVSLVDPDVRISPDRQREMIFTEVLRTDSDLVDVEPTVARIHRTFPGRDGGVNEFAAEGVGELMGRPVAALDVTQNPDVTVELIDDQPRVLNAEGRWVPSMVSGRLRGHEVLLGPSVPVVASLNGRIVAAGWTYPFEDDPARFDFVLPDELMVLGENEVELYVAQLNGEADISLLRPRELPVDVAAEGS